jgi:hypothetical protein
MIVTRKRREKRRYFTQETEDAIVRYNNASDPKEKNKIYEEEIHYAFFKLTQNIIHTFKFYHTDVDDIEHLQHEIIIFLLSKIHLFNPERGAKAYSYFGTIVKRWLILYNDKNYKKKVDKSSMEDLEKDENHSYTIDNNPADDKLSYFLNEYIKHVSDNIFEIFPKNNDAHIADAVLELFRKREEIDIFNKKALYIYIHEMIDVKTPKITKIANTLQDIFKKNYVFYLENDYIDFEENDTQYL